MDGVCVRVISFRLGGGVGCSGDFEFSSVWWLRRLLVFD